MAVFLPCYLTLGQAMVEVTTMAPPSKGPVQALPHSAPPALQQAGADPRLPRDAGTLPGTSGSVCWGSLPLSPGSWCTRFCVCPPRVCVPVLCELWRLYDGVKGDLLQEGFWKTQGCCTQGPCHCGRPLLTVPCCGSQQTGKI